MEVQKQSKSLAVATTTSDRQGNKASFLPSLVYNPKNEIHIVTWLMPNNDILSFEPLVKLLYTIPYQHHVQRLELIVPDDTVKVPVQLVQDLAHWIKNISRQLREVVLLYYSTTVTTNTARYENVYLKLLERAAEENPHILDCSIKCIDHSNIVDGNSIIDFLCDSLSTTVDGRLLRHLALDNQVLFELHAHNLQPRQQQQQQQQQQLNKLAIDLSWDRSICICLFKDFTSSKTLSILLPKLANGPLHTLKICYDPLVWGNNNTNRYELQQQQQKQHQKQSFKPQTIMGPSFQELITRGGLQEFFKTSYKNKKVVSATLQRLYFGNIQFQAQSLKYLVDSILKYCEIKKKPEKRQQQPQPQTQPILFIEFSLCRFESGTGTELQRLVIQSQKEYKQNETQSLALHFHYPAIIKLNT